METIIEVLLANRSFPCCWDVNYLMLGRLKQQALIFSSRKNISVILWIHIWHDLSSWYVHMRAESCSSIAFPALISLFAYVKSKSFITTNICASPPPSPFSMIRPNRWPQRRPRINIGNWARYLWRPHNLDSWTPLQNAVLAPNTSNWLLQT